ncbi:cytochrome c [bacterium]|jgi:cytochrome c553|nr:cytochrome c [bacterium]
MKKLVKLAVAGTLLVGSTVLAGEYQKCAGCHGQQGEKKALGKSKPLNIMNATDFKAAMKGYVDGTYGGSMKGLMRGQAKRVNDVQLEAIVKELNLK